MANTYTSLIFHVIFSTKHRQPLLQNGIRQRLHAYMNGIIKGEGGRPLAIGGVSDHVHLAIGLKADLPVAEMVKRLKSNSSRWLNTQKFFVGRFSWQAGYAASSVSPSQLVRVVTYIRRQEEHHRKIPFKSELVQFLRSHEIPFNPDHLWR